MIIVFINIKKILFRVGSIIKKLIWKLFFGKNFKIGNNVIFYPKSKVIIDKSNNIIGKVSIGDNCFFNSGCTITSLNDIRIGNNCIFGENVYFYDHDHNHQINNTPFKKQGYRTGKIIIGNNVWIGTNSVVLRNTIIGENTVIGAGCVVKGNIPPNSLIYNKSNEIRNMKEY